MPTSGEKKRLFLGVNLGISTTRKIAEAAARMRAVAEKKGLRVGWVPAANLHVTLKFLGWAPADVVAAVRDRVADTVAGVRAFDLGARGAGAFPSAAAPRVLWIGVHDHAGTLAQLAGRVETAMVALGFARDERAFAAHITVGRVKEGQAGAEDVLAPFRSMDFGNSIIREVVLYESLTKSTGSEYIAQARIALEPAAGRPERQTRDVEPVAAEGESDPNGRQS